MKQELMLAVVAQLFALGVRAVASDKTDLIIDEELLDAAFIGGKKKLRYESMILLDERAKTVKMYEKTTETSAGVSFGMSAETSFQSGSTLMRKVKRVQFDPTGKVLEFNFDLGDIPKTVKAAAKAQGWEFKTVILKSNASYR